MKAWRALRGAPQRLRAYVRHDLREIVAPQSMPDPPDVPPPERRSWRGIRQRIRQTNEVYMASWREEKPQKPQEEESPLAEDLTGIARGSAMRARPYFQHLYASRATLYRDALQQFLQGYREGYAAEQERPGFSEPGVSEDKPSSAAKASAYKGQAAPLNGSGPDSQLDTIEAALEAAKRETNSADSRDSKPAP